MANARQYAARSVGPDHNKTPLYYARRQAARRLASGWTMEQATGRCSEYGWVRQFDRSPARPLLVLAMREAELSADRAAERMFASLDSYLESTGRLALASMGVAA